MLVGNLPVFEADNDSYCHLNGFSCRRDVRQQPINCRRVLKADHQFFNDLTFTDRPRHAYHLHIWREKFANKMIAIECTHAITPHASSRGRHMIEMWIIAHRRHGCVKVTAELSIHM